MTNIATLPAQTSLEVFKMVVDQMHKSGKFASVDFIKKDGTSRSLRFLAAQRKKYVAKGGQAAETRRKNNPNLINLIDFDKYLECKKADMSDDDARKKAFRSVDAKSIRRIAFNGNIWFFGAA